MSFPTAVSLSLNNLMTKKGRTILTSFAGSIGIIGIALILALSTGINEYINNVQEQTLSSYPLIITRETTDTEQMMLAMMGESDSENKSETDSEQAIYANTAMYDMFNTMNSSAKQINNMKDFKAFVDSNDIISENSNAVSYGYDIQMPVFTKDEVGRIVKSDLNELFAQSMGMGSMMGSDSMAMMGSSGASSMFSVQIWEELLSNEAGNDINPMLYDQYDVVAGSWPKNYNEIVIVLNENNEIPDMATYALGLKPAEKLTEIIKSAMRGEEIMNYGKTKWYFDELMGKNSR